MQSSHFIYKSCFPIDPISIDDEIKGIAACALWVCVTHMHVKCQRTTLQNDEIVKAKVNQCRVKRHSFHSVPLLAIVPKNTTSIRWLSSRAIWRKGAWRRRIKNRTAGRDDEERREEERRGTGSEKKEEAADRRKRGCSTGSATREGAKKGWGKITRGTWEKRNVANAVGNLA